MTHWALAVLATAVAGAAAGQPTRAAAQRACLSLTCLQADHASLCVQAASTLETCLAFLQRLEAARRNSSSAGVALLLGETLTGLARKDVPPQAKERYLERARAAFKDVVRLQPLSASGYLGLAEVAGTGDERVEWLRGAVQAEFQPAHMELLSRALSDVGGNAAELEAARVLDDAYMLESSETQKWRYAASSLQKHTVALERYPLAENGRSVDNVVLRFEDDIDYVLLQRMLLEPESYLAYLSNALATMCEKSVAAIVTLDECMAGLELSVVTAEGSPSAGERRLLAEAVLIGMRTIAGESLPRSPITQKKFRDWIDRLLTTTLEPVQVSVDLLEARADYTANLLDRAQTLLAAIELVPNQGDLRLKLGATYVSLWFWPEALEELRVARYFLPEDEHERVDRLVATADKGYQARFSPPSDAN